ncbi:SNF2/helicase domain containing protein [Nitzschia inconspicua]|uniref:SNF2/helicase domain containing protein n=1 Tax=Nitzschia inconspicua TaxID=303405 RepID=A0A9K3L6Z5_9STRA|nr:SNF2/helicase domain containing protein [Nitzschia inconspicua]
MEDFSQTKSRRAKRDREPCQSLRKNSATSLVVDDESFDPSTKSTRSNNKKPNLSLSTSLTLFPPVLRIYAHDPKKKTIFDYESLSCRACELWRSPSGGLQAANHHRPAGVCRRLGVIHLELLLLEDDVASKKSTKNGNKKKQKTMPSTKQYTESQIYNLLVDRSLSMNTMQWKKPSGGRFPSKAQARKDVVFIYGEKDYHNLPGHSTQASLIQKVQEDWSRIVKAGRVVPRWNKSGEIADPATPTTCKRLLKLLKNRQLKDPHPDRHAILYNGLEHIPTDAVSVLEAIVDLSTPSQALYGVPLLVSVPKIDRIERLDTATKEWRTSVHFSIGIYANRLLFDVMTQKLQIVMAALDDESITVLKGLSSPPSLASDPTEEPVFVSDPKGPKVSLDFVVNSSLSDSDESHTTEYSRSQKGSTSYNPPTKEFDDVGASDGTLDAFTPSGFLKLIENTGTNMDGYEALETLLGDTLQVDLMLHQKHALSFMYKMEHLNHGINSLIWEERKFPEGGKYFYSPILGQLRLALGHSAEPVRGGILADEMGLGKTCAVLALIMASLSEIKDQIATENKPASTSATLIIVPPALLSQWVSEVFKVAGDNLVVDVFDHNRLEFQRRSNHPVTDSDADVVLTTYQSLEKAKRGGSSKAANILLSTNWARVVLDEMQEVRSHTSSISKNCNALTASRRWMLSGTPLFEGFSDLRGELCFLRLDPFDADSEDGFFDFAITQHIDNRSQRGLETLRVLGLLLLRRSKSMIVKGTNLPLLGLKRMTIKFQSVPQDLSERAIYCFLEHLMHSILDEYNGTQPPLGQSETSSSEKRSFLRVLREVCASVHLLNGGYGCSSQIPILDRWMKAYNRKFIERKQENTLGGEDKTEHFTCDEAIRFISQADEKVNHQSDFVSNLRLGHGGGVASRSRAMADKVREKFEDGRLKIDSKNVAIVICQRKQARIRWHKALESVTTGGLPDREYASTNLFFSKLWMARRTTPFGHGWRPRPLVDEEKALEEIRKRMGCNWATQSALCVSDIPSAVTQDELVTALLKCIENDMKKRNMSSIVGKIEVIKKGVRIISSGSRSTASSWKALVVLQNRTLVDIVVKQTKEKIGLRIKTQAFLPQIEEQAARAKERFELAETMAIIHPTENNKAKKIETQREHEIAKSLRAFGEYKEGHVLVTRSHDGFRLTDRPRTCLVQSLNSAVQSLAESILTIQHEIEVLKENLNSLQTKMTSDCTERTQSLTAVEALQALQHGRSEETTCPVCQERLGDNGGLVAATQCGHLSCSQCMEDWKKEKQRQTLTCMECRKPVNCVITIDPTKKENKELIEERKNDARELVRKAAKLLQENGSGALDPRLWQALYETLELPDDADRSRDRHFPAIPGEVLGHIRVASQLPVHSGSKVTGSMKSLALSSKVRALLSDLPRDELSVVFTSSKSFLTHILLVLEMHDIGCRGLFTGQKEIESKAALDDWHNDEKVMVLVVQAGAAACGLTLTASRKLFLMEPFLKYEEEQQAYARLHRYGQKNQVSCTVYYSPVSIESRLLEWRKQSNGYVVDDQVQFTSLDGSDADEEKDLDDDWDESDNENQDSDMEEEQNLTKFLLNLRS